MAILGTSSHIASEIQLAFKMKEILIVMTAALALCRGNDGYNEYLHDDSLRVSVYITRSTFTFDECKTQCPSDSDGLVDLSSPPTISQKTPPGQVNVWGTDADRINCVQGIIGHDGGSQGSNFVHNGVDDCIQSFHCLCLKVDAPLTSTASLTTAPQVSPPTTLTPQTSMTLTSPPTIFAPSNSSRQVKPGFGYKLQRTFALPPNATTLVSSTQHNSIRCAALCESTSGCKSFTMNFISHLCCLYKDKFMPVRGQQHDVEYYVKLNI